MIKRNLKYFFGFTGLLSITAVIGRLGNLERDLITPLNAILSCIVLFMFVGLSYICYKVLDSIYDN